MSDINEDTLAEQIRVSCDKHELRGEKKEKIEKWIENALLQYGLLKNIEAGFIEVCGVSPEDGDVMFQLTEAGRLDVEKRFN